MVYQLKEKKTVTNPRDVVDILQTILSKENEIDQQKEHFFTIGLNSRNVIQYIDLVSLGTLDSSLVHPREVFRLAIMKGVASIIIAHNHPSGDTEPSGDDLTTTKRLVEAGKIVGIEILDNLIITTNGFFSFANKGLINS